MHMIQNKTSSYLVYSVPTWHKEKSSVMLQWMPCSCSKTLHITTRWTQFWSQQLLPKCKSYCDRQVVRFCICKQFITELLETRTRQLLTFINWQTCSTLRGRLIRSLLPFQNQPEISTRSASRLTVRYDMAKRWSDGRFVKWWAWNNWHLVSPPTKMC